MQPNINAPGKAMNSDDRVACAPSPVPYARLFCALSLMPYALGSKGAA
jgi:hypothetical protein